MRARVFFVLLMLLVCLVALVPGAHAQDVTITNLEQLAGTALSMNYSFCVSFSPWDWRAYPIDWPLWCDSSSLDCLSSLPASTNLDPNAEWSNIPLAEIILT